MDRYSKSYYEQAKGVRAEEEDSIEELHQFFWKPSHAKRNADDEIKTADDDVTRIYDAMIERQTTEGRDVMWDLMHDSEIVCVAFDGFNGATKPLSPPLTPPRPLTRPSSEQESST